MGRRAFGPIRDYLEHSRSWHAAILLTVPLFALYEVGLVFMDSSVHASSEVRTRNAADVFLREVLQVHGARATLILNAVVLVAFLVAARLSRSRGPVFRWLPMLMLEGLLWALLLVPVTSLLVRLAAQEGVPDRLAQVVLGIGAGLYEEVVFRLLALAGGFALLHRLFKMKSVWAASVAVIVSSLLFSAYHHVGPGGEDWDARIFLFRFLAGVLLSWLFLFRGFAVTCWTHAIYDVLCVL